MLHFPANVLRVDCVLIDGAVRAGGVSLNVRVPCQSENCGSAMVTDGPRLPKQAEQINAVARAVLSGSAPT